MSDLKVFISYAREDSAFVGILLDHLSHVGIRAWTDSQILPGENWKKSIEVNLSNSDLILLVVSKASLKSEWTKMEAETMLARGKKIIPLLLEKIEPKNIPSFIKNIQWIDFTEDSIDGMKTLLNSLPAQFKSTEALITPLKKNKGYVFLSFTDYDSDFVTDLKEFLKNKGYAYWDYREVERNYQSQFFLELEQAISEAKATLSILSEDWKKSNWTVKEYIFSEDVGTPVFLLKAKPIGPTLITAGVNYIDFTCQKELGFKKLEVELQKKGL